MAPYLQKGVISMRVLAALLVLATSVCAADAPRTKAYFSPRGGCTKAVVELVDSAKKQILVMAYSFTSKSIVDALSRAKARGVDVKAIIDAPQHGGKYTGHIVGVDELWDDKHAIQHAKLLIVDEETVELGSFNYTDGAEERNSEALVICPPDKELARAFIENWKKHAEHSKVLPPGRKKSSKSR